MDRGKDRLDSRERETAGESTRAIGGRSLDRVRRLVYPSAVAARFERYGARIVGDRLEQPHGATVVACVARDEARRVRPCEGPVSADPGRDRRVAGGALVVAIAVLVFGEPFVGVGAGGLVPILAVALIVPVLVAIVFWMRSSQRRQMLEVELADGTTKRIVLEAFCDATRRDEVARELEDRGWPVEFR